MPFNKDGTRKTMAYKKANAGAPTAFKMRSGNGPLQFKLMGASPVKQVKTDTPETDADRATRLETEQKTLKRLQSIEGTPEYEAQAKQTNIRKGEEEYMAEQKKKKEKAKVDATRGTEEGQVKKQGKLDKIKGKRDKKIHKKNVKADILAAEIHQERENNPGVETKKLKRLRRKYKNKTEKVKKLGEKETNREARLKKEVNMTPEEYKANQADKKQKFQDSMNRLAMTVHPNHDPSQVAEFDESVRTRGQKEETERINNAYKEADTKRMNQAMDAYKAEQLKQGKLAADIPSAGGVDDVNMENTDTKKSE